MRQRLEFQTSVRVLMFGLATSWSTAAAFAACGMPQVGGGGSGPPSISATETSTAQVLEQIRRRTQVAQEAQPIPVSNTVDVPPATANTAAATSSGSQQAAAQTQAKSQAAQSQAAQSSAAAAKTTQAEPPVSVTKPKSAAKAKTAKVEPQPEPAEPAEQAKPKVSKAQTEPEPVASPDEGYVSLKDGPLEHGVASGLSRTSAVWAQAFADYDRHSNLAPGNQENPTRREFTGGGVFGADWTHVRHAEVVEAVQFGVFAGYSDSRAKFSDTQFTFNDPGTTNLQDTYNRTNSRQDIEGPFVGTYFAYVHDKWTSDVTFKADFFDVDAKSLLIQTTCGTVTDDFGQQSGSASLTDYVIAANESYRHPLSENSWLEPTVGIRFTYSDFGSDPSVTHFVKANTNTLGRLGFEDGDSLRLQIGARYGERWITPNGYHAITTLGAFLYSDVLINGFTFTSPTVGGLAGETVSPVDEGKVRALGQFATKIDAGDGVSYLLQAEVRGGEDVIGFGGQLGVRYEW
jgi:hypothetical protein